MRVWFALVSVSLSKVLILNPSASPVWLPYKREKKADVTPVSIQITTLKEIIQIVMGEGEDKKSPYIVQEVSNFENQLTKDWQAMTGQKIWKT